MPTTAVLASPSHHLLSRRGTPRAHQLPPRPKENSTFTTSLAAAPPTPRLHASPAASRKNTRPQKTPESTADPDRPTPRKSGRQTFSRKGTATPPKKEPPSTTSLLSTTPPTPHVPPPPPTWAPWGVQLLGDWKQGEVLASYEKLRRRHLTVLRDKDPLIVVTYGPSGMSKRFLVRVAENTRQEAEQVCSKLQHEGASCFAVRNPSEQETAVRSERYARLTAYAQTYPSASTRSHASRRSSR